MRQSIRQFLAICIALLVCGGTNAWAQRGGGHGGGSRSAARPNVNRDANRNVNVNHNENVNRNTNVNRNVNRNVNVNVDRDVDVHVHGGYYGGGCCYHSNPVATAVAVTATAMVIGSIVHSIPPSCTTVIVNGLTYQQCGSTWYQPQFVGSTTNYVVVAAPR